MPFVGDPEWKLLDYCASIELEEKLTVLFVDGSRDDGPSRFVTKIDGVEHWIDDETDLLGLAPEGAVVSFERGGVTVAMQRVDGKLTAWASAWMGGVKTIGAKASNIEGALLALVEKDRGADCPRLCFYCTHSDYEPSTGFGGGHLACFVESALAYDQVARSPNPRERKWGMWRDDLSFRWVDELDTCSSWQRRPPKHGYRG